MLRRVLLATSLVLAASTCGARSDLGVGTAATGTGGSTCEGEGCLASPCLSDGTACDDCIQSMCCTTAMACLTSASCHATLECELACVRNGGANDNCFLQCGSVQESLVAATCSGNNCAPFCL